MRISIIIALALALAIPACSEDPSIPFADSINVVALLPITGTFEEKGKEHQAAIQMAIRDLEAAGGLGRPIQLFVVDSTADAAVAGTRLEARLEELTVEGDVLVAGIISSTTAALTGAAPIALSSGIPHIEISSGSGLSELGLEDADPTYEFATRPLCMPEPEITAQFVASRAAQPDWQTVVVLRGARGHDLMHTEMFREALVTVGFTGTVVNPDDIVMEGDEPYETYFEQDTVRNADIVYYHLNGDEPNRDFITAAERTGFAGKIITCGMARSRKLLEPVVPAVADYMSAGDPDEGRFFFAMRGPTVTSGREQFDADLLAYSGDEAETYSPSAYDAMTLLGLAIADAGSTDRAAIRDALVEVSANGDRFTYGELEAAFAALRAGSDIDYDGVSSDLDMRMDPMQGYLTTGRYYIETVVQVGEDVWDYRKADPSPDVER